MNKARKWWLAVLMLTAVNLGLAVPGQAGDDHGRVCDWKYECIGDPPQEIHYCFCFDCDGLCFGYPQSGCAPGIQGCADDPVIGSGNCINP